MDLTTIDVPITQATVQRLLHTQIKRLKTLPLGNDEWLVISSNEEPKNQAKKTAHVINVISVLGTASQKKPKQIAQLRFESDESQKDKQNFIETTCSFLLRTMVKSKNQHTKLPLRLCFKDEELFNQVSTAFKNNRLQHFVDMDCLEEPLVMDSKDVQNHVNVFKNFDQGPDLPCNDDLPGVLLTLKKEPPKYVNGHTPKLAVTNFKVELPPPPKTTWLEHLLRYIFGLALLVALISCFIPAPKGIVYRHNGWPLPDEHVVKLKTYLQSNFSSYSSSVDAIVDAFEFHGADKALTINLIGTSNTQQKQIVQIIADVLYGDAASARVKYLPKQPAAVLKQEVFSHLKANPFSLIALEYSKVPPSELSWLTFLMDDNFPYIENDGDSASANAAVFILLTTVDAGTLQDITRGNNVEYRVKEEMKKAGWESRICQRIRHVIPLVEKA